MNNKHNRASHGNTDSTHSTSPEQTGHTPVPWIWHFESRMIHGGNFSAGELPTKAMAEIIVGQHNREVVKLAAQLRDDKEISANARLIAAAPDLLEALKRIMPYAHDGASIRDIDRSEQPEFVNARAAIAKAEGKA